MKTKVIEWLVSADTGTSSKTLCAVYYDIAYDEKWHNYPGDPSDFWRCKKFLACLSPKEKKIALQKVSKINKQWGGLAEKWEYLESLNNSSDLFDEIQKIVHCKMDVSK